MTVKERRELVEALERAEAALAQAALDVETTKASLGVADSPGTTVRELADRFGLAESALVAFAETIGDVLPGRPISDDVARRAALVAVSEEAWTGTIGPLLSSAQVRGLLGRVSRQRVDELLRARRLIGLRDTAGRRRFPAFQFKDGRPLPDLVSAFLTVADVSESDWTAAAWCVAADDALDGRSPAEWAREARSPERLHAVAGQDAARLAR